MRKTVCVLACSLLLLLTGCNLQRKFEGTWQDVNSEYRMYVDAESIYDNVTGLAVPYVRDKYGIIYTDNAGDMVTTQLSFDGNNKLALYVNGEVREFERVKEELKLSTLLSRGPSEESSSRTFERKSRAGPDSIDLLEDGSFVVHHGEDELSGVCVMNADEQSAIMYYIEDGRGVRAATLGCALDENRLYGFKLEKDGMLEAKSKKANVASDVVSGYTLDGIVGYSDFSTSFTFTHDGKCNKRSNGSDVITYNYNISSSGLVTLGQEGGLLSEYDYMYYDADSNDIYRVVFECSSWDVYVQQILSQASDISNELDIDYSITVSPNNFLPELVQAARSGSSSYFWGNPESNDAEYTSYACEQIATELARIQADDIARRRYEQASMTEKERFQAQVREQEKANQRTRAELDAKTQAIIAENQSSGSSYSYNGSYSGTPW